MSAQADKANYERRKIAYELVKAMFLAQGGEFGRKNRAPDYSEFDAWLNEQIKALEVKNGK